MYSIVKYCELSNVDNDGDHMDDEELGEERVEAQVALVAQQVTFLPTVSSAAASRSIWARGHPAKWSPYLGKVTRRKIILSRV